MQTERIAMTRAEAKHLFRKYKEHLHYSRPVDREILLAYQKLAEGKLVIKALDSIKAAGVNAQGFPKLAIARADAQHCLAVMRTDGSATLTDNDSSWRRSNGSRHRWFDFPVGSFPPAKRAFSQAKALTPLVPLHLRPKRGIANYHILWEAEWERVIPRDPYLLRRIGFTDMWVVVAMWDLTDVERTALAARL